MSDSLRPHELQHARPPCLSPTPGVHSNSHPSSRWCHPAISPSVVPFSSCPQSLPASESFPMSQLFTWGGWMASPTRWTWVWVDSGSWWWTGGPGMLRFMGSQRVGHDWVTELNWTDSCDYRKLNPSEKLWTLAELYFLLISVSNLFHSITYLKNIAIYLYILI